MAVSADGRSFATLVRRLRGDMSQQEFADELGVSRSLIANTESGEACGRSLPVALAERFPDQVAEIDRAYDALQASRPAGRRIGKALSRPQAEVTQWTQHPRKHDRLRQAERALRRAVARRAFLVCLSIGAFGGGLLWFSSDSERWSNQPTVRVFAAQLGAVLIAAVVIYILWELVARRSFAQEVLITAGIGSDVEKSGLVSIGTDYHTIDWEDLFGGTKNLDVFVAYAASWRTVHREKLKRLLQRPGTRVRVFLADPEDDEQLATLAKRFNTTVERLRIKIEEAVEDYARLRYETRGNLEIHHRGDSYLFAAYKFDSVVVVTMYSHIRDRTEVPVLIFRQPGTMFRFFEQEFKFFATPDQGSTDESGVISKESKATS